MLFLCAKSPPFNSLFCICMSPLLQLLTFIYNNYNNRSRSDCPADSRHNGLIRLCVEKASSKNHKRDLWLPNPPVHAKLGHLGVCAPVLRKALAQAGMYYCSSVGSGSTARPQPRGRHAYARSGDSNIFANVPAAFVDHTRGSGAQAEF